jgi:hypothetical protein
MTMLLGAVTPVPIKPRYQVYDGWRRLNRLVGNELIFGLS